MIATATWARAHELERAQGAILRAAREDPLLDTVWHRLVTASEWTGSPAAALSVASAWLPNDASFVPAAASYRGDELPARLRDAALAYVLEPRFESALHFGRALAEAGRADEARALAAMPIDGSGPNRVLDAYLLAFVDLHEARMGRAITRLEEAGDVAMVDLVVVADVAGRAEDVATRWSTRFLSLPDERVSMTARGYVAPMVLCMRARRDAATPCRDRVSRLGHAALNWWGDDGEALLAGARRYAAGDVVGAAAAWRALVASPNAEIVRVLPTEAFERAGEPALAARLDVQKMRFTFLAGVSDAAPREAKRAFASGDRASATRLAQSVVHAWEVADVAVPAVARMRAPPRGESLICSQADLEIRVSAVRATSDGQTLLLEATVEEICAR